MTTRQSGAFEIFLNGQLIQRVGILSKDKHKIKAFSSSREPFHLPIQLGRPQILGCSICLSTPYILRNPFCKYKYNFVN